MLIYAYSIPVWLPTKQR